jgi:hypothetical protein
VILVGLFIGRTNKFVSKTLCMLVWITFKNSDLTSKKTQHFTIINISRLNPFKGTIAVYSENYNETHEYKLLRYIMIYNFLCFNYISFRIEVSARDSNLSHQLINSYNFCHEFHFVCLCSERYHSAFCPLHVTLLGPGIPIFSFSGNTKLSNANVSSNDLTWRSVWSEIIISRDQRLKL